MRHATKPQCDKSQACLIGAGGVRGVTESYAGYGVCALRARREVAERPTEAEGKYPFSLDSKEPKWELFQDYLKGEVLNHKGTIVSFRFCSKTVPERGRRTLRRRSGERPVAIQELSQNVGNGLVRFVTLAVVTNPTSACSAQRGNQSHGLSVYNKGRAYTCASLCFSLYVI